VAHELRTPVTILQASCEELADGLAEPTPERLASLHQEVLRLGRVVEDLELLAAVDHAGGLVQLVVADTGPGIEPDELAHLFDRFWRGRAATGTPGSGVGLTVVAELVRADGGRIHVASTPRTGTVFTVCLPEAA